MVDVLSPPHRLEDAVSEAYSHDALNHLLAKEVVDTEKLAFVTLFQNARVELFRALEIAAERLLDDNAAERPAGFLFEKPALAKLVHDRTEKPRAHREVENGTALATKLRGEVLIAVRLAEICPDVTHLVRDPTPLFFVDVRGVELGHLIPRKALHGLSERLAPAVVIHVVMVQADYFKVIGQQLAAGQVVERRHEQAFGQIAACAEDDERASGCWFRARGPVLEALSRVHGMRVFSQCMQISVRSQSMKFSWCPVSPRGNLIWFDELSGTFRR